MIRMAPGSSPLARGLHNLTCGVSDCTGIIPARAGFTGARCTTGDIRTDHPRSRGVYAVRKYDDEFQMGSSPLARGLLFGNVGVLGGIGIIPARAGFTNR